MEQVVTPSAATAATVVKAASEWRRRLRREHRHSYSQAPARRRKGSKQSNAVDVITANQANAGSAGSAGLAGSATAGLGGSPSGVAGHVTPGSNGSVDTFRVGIGGGIAIIGTAVIDNSSISGNHATTTNSDVDGTFSP